MLFVVQCPGIFVAVFLGCTSTGRVDLCFLWFYVQELPKYGSTGSGSGFKASQRTGQRLKVSSHRLVLKMPNLEIIY